MNVAKFFFTELKVPFLLISSTFHYASLAAGLSDATLVDMGETVTEIGAVSEYTFLKSSIIRHVVNGSVVSKYLMNSLKVNREQADDIKHNFLTVPSDFDSFMEESTKPVEYKGVQLTQERAIGAELYFKPFFEDLESDGLAADIKLCINKAPMNSRKALWSRIVIFGGASKMKGLAERLQKEVVDIAPGGFKDLIKVQLSSAPDYLPFIGASVIASTKHELALSIGEFNSETESSINKYFMN